jgi:hypothetical protein
LAAAERKKLSAADAALLYLLLDDVDHAGFTRGLACRADWIRLKHAVSETNVGSMGSDLFCLLDGINRCGVIAGTDLQVRWHLARTRIESSAV